jgi:hypothetical protein
MTRAWPIVQLTAFALAALPARGAAQARLFRDDSALAVTLRTDLRGLFADRDTTREPTWRTATLSYAGDTGTETVALRVRTRGTWRRANCEFPPVRLRFTDSAARGTPFHGVHAAKLVVPCRGPEAYEQLVLLEYGVYRVLQLLTPASLATRLVHLTYADEQGRTRAPRWAFVTEEPDRLAQRLGGFVVTGGSPTVKDLSPYQAALLGVFEYFIGNTDWSMPARHNIVVLTVQDSAYAVPYDFDWTGVVDAPYAQPLSALPIKSVRERMWRGRCQSVAELEPILSRFEALRDTITALYRAIPGLERRQLDQALGYYDDFYREIADRQRFVRRLVERDCRG